MGGNSATKPHRVNLCLQIIRVQFELIVSGAMIFYSTYYEIIARVETVFDD